MQGSNPHPSASTTQPRSNRQDSPTLAHLYPIFFFGCCVSSQRAHCREGKMSRQTQKQHATPKEPVWQGALSLCDFAAQSSARIRRAGTPPSAPQPQFGPRRTDRSNSLWLTADKRGAINTRANGEEAGMEIKIITDAIRKALHLRVRGVSWEDGQHINSCSWSSVI